MLRAAHVGQARLVIVALPSAAGGERVVGLIRQLYPRLRILARVPGSQTVERLRAAGASAVVVDALTTARDLAERAILLYEPRAGRSGKSARGSRSVTAPGGGRPGITCCSFRRGEGCAPRDGAAGKRRLIPRA